MNKDELTTPSRNDGNTFVVGSADLSEQKMQSLFDINSIDEKITVIKKELGYLSKKIKKLNELGVQVEVNISLSNII